MRWYWAILITVGLLALPVMMGLNGASDGAVDTYCKALVIISAIYAGLSAGSIGWGVFVLLLWPIAFPAFLMSGLHGASESELSQANQSDRRDQEALSEQDAYRDLITRHRHLP